MTTTTTAKPARIGVVKPDFGVAGGFEYLLARLVAIVEQAGHDVHTVPVPGRQLPRPMWNQPDAASRWFDHPDFFNYLGMVHDVRRLELDEFDLVISTQPPSFLAPHSRILGLFYHQARIFYELSEMYIKAGFVESELHRRASEHVRSIDNAHVDGVVGWLAGSQECATRLHATWNVTAPVDLLAAPPLVAAPPDPPSWRGDGPVLCVGRLEWPKRAELVVAAGHLLDRPTIVQGGGGRLSHLRNLATRLATGQIDPQALPSNTLDAISEHAARAGRTLPRRAAPSPVHITGHVSDEDRDAAYGSASVVIAPAYREDYGLTALEAMAWGRPVVVCSDGGGLVEIVESTGAGLVVAPEPGAIADAVKSIVDDPALAAELRQRALDSRATYTWSQAGTQMMDAINRSLS